METQQIPPVAALQSLGLVQEVREDRGQLIVWVEADRIVEACRLLKQQQGYVRLSYITAVDWHPLEPRFEVVYSLHSFASNHWMRMKCRVGGAEPELDSVTGVWRAANWYEREVWDLFGIRFRRHPDLRRIMMPQEWEGHPLRKDYPLSGDR